MKLKTLIKEIQNRDQFYYIQHILDMDVEKSSEALMKDLLDNINKWINIYDPALNGNVHGWYPSSSLQMEKYRIKLTPNIFREDNKFRIFGVEIDILEKDITNTKHLNSKEKLVKHEEIEIDTYIDDQNRWDVESLKVKINNLIREVKEILKRDYK